MGIDIDEQASELVVQPGAEVSRAGIANLDLVPAQVPHDIDGFSIVALGFNICKSWIGMASSLAIGITLGGTVTVLYGNF